LSRASIVGKVEFQICCFPDQSFKILDVPVDLENADPFGKVSGGYLLFRGRLQEEANHDPTLSELHDISGDLIGGVQFDCGNEEEEAHSELFLLRVGMGEHFEFPKVAFIVQKPVTDDES
jgi:hypothetical protein